MADEPQDQDQDQKPDEAADTSRLQRIKPQTDTQESAGDDDDFTTETVHLKVIKDSKKMQQYRDGLGRAGEDDMLMDDV